MELKERIEKILKENKINPQFVIDLGCGVMPYSDLFQNSQILGLDVNQNIKLYHKMLKNRKISFKFQNFNLDQRIPKGDLVIASLILHFIDKEPREKLFAEIAKSKNLLIAHLDKKVHVPTFFDLIASDEFETPLEKHDSLQEHSHKIFLELYKPKST